MAGPTPIAERLNEAIAHHNAGRLERAGSIYRQLAQQAPQNAVVPYLMAQLCEQQGRVAEALRHYARALQLDPGAVMPGNRCANLLIAHGRIPEAEALLRRLVQRAPNSPLAWNSLGFALKVAGKSREALACHQKAVDLDPKYAEGWLHFGLTLGVVGKNHEALKCFDFALTLQADNVMARYGRAQSLHKLYRTKEAVAEYDAVIAAQPDNLEARSYRLFALQNLDTLTREQLFAEHVAYGRIAAQSRAAASAVSASRTSDLGSELQTRNSKPETPNPKVRLAILSPDLRTHSCACFLEPLLCHLNPAEFELYLYHDHFVEDSVSLRFRTMAAKWRNFVGQPSERVEQAIRADKPDILIDLSGHVGGTIRLPLFAKRLAPVQISYLGYPDTTGLNEMDYRFTDSVADPEPDADRFAVETLVRFSPCAWAYQPPADAPAVAPVQPDGAPITFGCFNSPVKFNDTLYATWAELLRRVPGSRLLLKGRDFDEPSVREGVLRQMQAQGLDPQRVTLLSRTITTAEHLAQYAQVDVALDSFPYNGTTTTCEALWMGRPVVTFAGDRHASRVSASLLTAIGHPELIALDREGYIILAAELAADRTRLGTYASTLRGAMQRSVLLDHAGQSARFAAALRLCRAGSPRRAGRSTVTPEETGSPSRSEFSSGAKDAENTPQPATLCPAA